MNLTLLGFFKLLSLAFQDIDETGTILFDTEEAYSIPKWEAGKPFVLTATFVGEIPNLGFSYVDGDGVARRFAVGISGYDGSLYLMEF